MTKRMFGSKIKIALALIFIATVGCTVACGMAAGQYCGPCAGFSGMPVTMATPCGAIASAGGVTACSDATGAVASAGGLTVGSSSLFPAAFAGPIASVSPYYYSGLPF